MEETNLNKKAIPSEIKQNLRFVKDILDLAIAADDVTYLLTAILSTFFTLKETAQILEKIATENDENH